MNYRSRKLLDMCREMPCELQLPGCIGGTSPDAPSVPCHSNLGRHGHGMGIKAHDVFAVPGCTPCHFELDNGGRYNKAEKEEIFMAAFERWVLKLFKCGKVRAI